MTGAPLKANLRLLGKFDFLYFDRYLWNQEVSGF